MSGTVSHIPTSDAPGTAAKPEAETPEAAGTDRRVETDDAIGAGDDAGAAVGRRFEIDIYQIADDAMFRNNRTDGTGWDWSWADWRREWMDETPNKFAYRCLPLTIANQTGWHVYNPVGFTAVWTGNPAPGGVQILFDADSALWGQWVNNQFGRGIVTWNTPFLFRTRPTGSRLLVTGPANRFKHGIQPLMAVIETDWMTMSFTMNWKFTAPDLPVRFDIGEPLFQAIPLGANICADLEHAHVTYSRLWDVPDVQKAYRQWSDARNRFHEMQARGEVRPDAWQKEYFKGRDVYGQEAPTRHMTRITPPQIHYRTGEEPTSS